MPKSALIKVYSIQGMHLFCYHDVKRTRFKIELIKINTTNYYTIVLNKSGFTQPIQNWTR